MIISIFDYGSGNIKSVSKAVELAANNLQKNVSVQVIHDPKKLKRQTKLFYRDKVRLSNVHNIYEAFLEL